MKVSHNIFKHSSSNHQDEHPDKINSHQHRGKVDKTYRAKIVEFDKLDNDPQIDNDFSLHIIYFLQHGYWKVNDRSHQMKRVWFYNSEPSIDIQEYNRLANNTADAFIFTIIPDSNHMLKLSSPITVTVKCKSGYYSINSSGDKSDTIYKIDGFSIIVGDFFTFLGGNSKPDRCWDVSKEMFTKEEFDNYIKPVFSKIDFYKQCGVVSPQDADTAYFGDTDGRIGAVLYVLLVLGHIGIREKDWNLLHGLLRHEEMASSVYRYKNNKVFYDLLNMKDMILNELHQRVFLKDDAVTPCIFLGDHTGDRFSIILGDKYILTLLNSMRNIEGNKDSCINKSVVVLTEDHEINFNGSHIARLASYKLSAGDMYSLIKTLDVCNYDSERQILTSHHGIIRDKEKKCYRLGALQVPSNQIKNSTDPKELANIFNKKHKEHMSDRFIHLIRNNAIVSAPVHDNYSNNTTAFRPKSEGIFKRGQALEKTKQKYGHYGLGIDQHQKIDNHTMGPNSWKIAPNERGDKKGVPGLSCSQLH